MWPISELPATDFWIARMLQARRDLEMAAQMRKDREEDERAARRALADQVEAIDREMERDDKP